MKITVNVSEKIGLPAYSSAGAACSIELDVAEKTVSESPDSLRDEIRRAYALAEQAVHDQLVVARRLATEAEDARRLPPPSVLDRPAGAPEPQDLDRPGSSTPARDRGYGRQPEPSVDRAIYDAGRRAQARSPSAPEPDRDRDREPRPRSYDPDPRSRPNDAPPRDGRQLYPWAKKQQDYHGCAGLINALQALGDREGYPRKLTEWNRDEVAEAVRLWRQMPAREPARNGDGRNGDRR